MRPAFVVSVQMRGVPELCLTIVVVLVKWNSAAELIQCQASNELSQKSLAGLVSAGQHRLSQ